MSGPESVSNEDMVDLLREIRDDQVDDAFIPADDELYDDEFDADEYYDRAENEDFYAQYGDY